MRSLLLLGLLVCVAAFPSEAQTADAAGTYPRLHIGGFTDFGFFATDEKGAASATSGFKEGQFILHFNSALAERVSFFGEVSTSPKSDGFKVEMERTIIRFAASNHLVLSMGRYHSPVNWWNDNFHHGLWLQTSITRPEMIRFGGKLVPVHFVGMLAAGTVSAANLDILYRAGVGNGRGTAIGRAGDAGDANNNRAWLVTLAVRPDALFGLEVGGGFYRDQVPLMAQPFRESISTAWVVWNKEQPEVIAEFAHVEHEPVAGGESRSSNGGYVQVAYRLPADERFKPYVRYEELQLNAQDAVFDEGPPDLVMYLAGVRFELSEFASAKLEGRRQREDGGDDVQSIHGQVSIVF